MATFRPSQPHARPPRRAAAGLLLALALHGALLFCWRRPLPPPDQARDEADPLVVLRLYAAAPAPAAPAPPPDRPAQRGSTTPPALRATAPERNAARAILPAPGAVTAEPATPPAATAPSSAPALDIDALKSVARKHAGDGAPHPLPDAMPALSASDRAQRALEGARRPRCDQNYRPMLGGVGFKELLALPLMLKEGASDSGCHW